MNQSFIDVHNQLKEEGIFNNDFFLLLWNKSLEGVDPHDPTLSDNLKIAVINECRINFWYYLREVIRVPTDCGNSIPFHLNKANLASMWCLLNSVNFYMSVSRQCYSEIGLTCISQWIHDFGAINTSILRMDGIHKSLILAQKNMKIRNFLPDYVRRLVFNNGSDHETFKSNGSLGNTYDFKTFPDSQTKAEYIGKNLSHRIQIMTNFEFIPFVRELVNSSSPSFSATWNTARRNGNISCRAMCSIPARYDSDGFRLGNELIRVSAKWTNLLYDIPSDYLHNYINKNSCNGLVFISYLYNELGRTEEWFNDMCALLNNNPDLINREILLKRDVEVHTNKSNNESYVRECTWIKEGSFINGRGSDVEDKICSKILERVNANDIYISKYPKCKMNPILGSVFMLLFNRYFKREGRSWSQSVIVEMAASRFIDWLWSGELPIELIDDNKYKFLDCPHYADNSGASKRITNFINRIKSDI